jgi:hypothetical protein
VSRREERRAVGVAAVAEGTPFGSAVALGRPGPWGWRRRKRNKAVEERRERLPVKGKMLGDEVEWVGGTIHVMRSGQGYVADVLPLPP